MKRPIAMVMARWWLKRNSQIGFSKSAEKAKGTYFDDPSILRHRRWDNRFEENLKPNLKRYNYWKNQDREIGGNRVNQEQNSKLLTNILRKQWRVVARKIHILRHTNVFPFDVHRRERSIRCGSGNGGSWRRHNQSACTRLARGYRNSGMFRYHDRWQHWKRTHTLLAIKAGKYGKEKITYSAFRFFRNDKD